MAFGDTMGKTALASRLQNAASFTESSERRGHRRALQR